MVSRRCGVPVECADFSDVLTVPPELCSQHAKVTSTATWSGQRRDGAGPAGAAADQSWDVDRGDVHCGFVADGAFVVAGRGSPVALESVDCAPDGVALPVQLRAECWRSAALLSRACAGRRRGLPWTAECGVAAVIVVGVKSGGHRGAAGGFGGVSVRR
jgi:hypothetical protein